MKIFFTSLLLLYLSIPVQAQFEFAGKIEEYSLQENQLSFKLTNALFNLYVIDDHIIRFRFTNKDDFYESVSYGIFSNNSFNTENIDFKETTDKFILTTSELKVEIKKNPCRIIIYNNKGKLINEDHPSFGAAFDKDEVRCFKTLFDDEKFFGLGEKTGSLNRRGRQFTMWNSDIPGYPKNQDPLYVSIPFFIGLRDNIAYGIYFDNTYKSYFNMGASNDRFYWFGAEKGELDYYFIYGPSIKTVISSYTDLTGKMPLPPLWALGYQQSKWSYYPESEVRSVAETFRSKKIPCDVIYLDIHYMDQYKVFTWDRQKFPAPEMMLSDLKSMGFNIIPIVDPGIKADSNYSAAKEGLERNLFVKYPDGEFYKGEVWPSWSYFPDFTKEETRTWWGEKIGGLLKQGVAGIWIDMNEPAVWGNAFPDIVLFDDYGNSADHKKIHNVYAHQMAKATFEGALNYLQNKRSFVLTRAGFSGVQRFAAVWTGDNLATEEHLKMAVTIPLGMGLSGLPFVGSDVGGFMGVPSPRLYTRWMQLGVFTPFFRAHSHTNQQDKEPWAFGDEIESYVREAINLRYRLLPFLYNEFYHSSVTGLPVMRPMFLNYQENENCYSDKFRYQFMIGENVLVAPVVNEFENFKKLYLPAGRWLDMRNNIIYEGSSDVIVEAPLNEIPWFLKEGGVIPMQDVIQYVGEKKTEEFIFHIFPADKFQYELYSDDGESLAYQNGVYSVRVIEGAKTENGIRLSVIKKYNKYEEGILNYRFVIYSASAVDEVLSGGKKLTSLESQVEFNTVRSGFFFDSDRKIIVIKIPAENEILLNINYY